jgi:carboxymethylenebutenolidase
MTSRVDRVQVQSHLASIDDSFAAYVSFPENPNGNAVVVLQEIFGVTASIKGVADRYADAGYIAVAPDLFWRVAPGLELTHSRDDMARAVSILADFSEVDALDDINATLSHVNALPNFDGRIAVVGLCLGGKLAYMAASRLPIAAAIAFYGVGIEKNLDEARYLASPLLMFFGGKDQYVSAEAYKEIQAAVQGKADIEVYPEAAHGFYTRGDKALIGITHRRALDFLDKNLAIKEAKK